MGLLARSPRREPPRSTATHSAAGRPWRSWAARSVTQHVVLNRAELSLGSEQFPVFVSHCVNPAQASTALYGCGVLLVFQSIHRTGDVNGFQSDTELFCNHFRVQW